MNTKVVDVSSYQGTIHWNNVKSAGVQGAILKIIQKNTGPDVKFETNWSGCKAAGIPIVGVYNYSYATTAEKAKTDAQAVLKVLNGRRTKVWLDVEDACQKGLGSGLISVIKSYQEVIAAAGLEFGVYTGLSFYNSYIRPYAGQIACSFWIARYPSSASIPVSRNPSASYRPSISHPLVGWQYTSKGSVAGINGNVDISIWYDESGLKESTSTAFSDAAAAITSKLTLPSHITDIQTWLNTYYKTGLAADGIYGPKTKAALVKAWQTEIGGLTADGIFGTKSKAAAASHVIRKGSRGILVTIWQAYLVCRGYQPNGIDGSFDAGCHAATTAFQRANGVTPDGQVGANTWAKAFA